MHSCLVLPYQPKGSLAKMCSLRDHEAQAASFPDKILSAKRGEATENPGQLQRWLNSWKMRFVEKSNFKIRSCLSQRHWGQVSEDQALQCRCYKEGATQSPSISTEDKGLRPNHSMKHWVYIQERGWGELSWQVSLTYFLLSLANLPESWFKCQALATWH